MPATLEAYQRTNAYRAQLLQLRTGATRAAAALWATVAVENLDTTGRAWQAASADQSEQRSRTAIRATTDYMAAYMAADLGQAPTMPELDEERAAQSQVDGGPLTAALAPALYTVKAAVAQGAGEREALNLGLVRATRIVAMEFTAVADYALDTLHQELDAVVGWRRATSGNACGACLAAATGAIQESGNVLRRHPHCRCVKEAVLRGVRERFRRPSGQELFDGLTVEQQNDLFRGRGGADKAQLVREKAIPIEDLLSIKRNAAIPDGIEETPLSRLTRGEITVAEYAKQQSA